jgi:hypothetical protein
MNSLNKQYQVKWQQVAKMRLRHNVRVQMLHRLRQQYRIDAAKLNVKRALVVGINYTGTSNALNGCIHDAQRIRTYLLANGWLDENIVMVTDDTAEKPTRATILSLFESMLKQPSRVCWFSYSGHGTYVRDTNQNEATGFDQCLVPCDLKYIVDDELKQIVKRSLKGRLFCMFDSCFSGSVMDLKYSYDSTTGQYATNEKETECGDVVMISGCTDRQTSMETLVNGKVEGAMTTALLTHSAVSTWQGMVGAMTTSLKDNGLPQRPQLSFGRLPLLDKSLFF